MPFTLSHPAAILPLYSWSKARLPLAALSIGSISPDVAYFIPLGLGTESHSLAGVLYFCWPAGMALWIIFEFVLRPPTLALMPEFLRARFSARRLQITARLLLNVSIAIMAGALTHVVWDSFTHATSPVVSALGILKTVVVDLDGEPLRLYKLLQHLSTVFGLGVLAYAAIAWLRSDNMEKHRPPAPGLSNVWRLLTFGSILVVSLAGSVVDYLIHPLGSLERQLFYICIGGMTGFALAWCAASVLITWKLSRRSE